MNKAWLIKAGNNGTAEIYLYGFIDSYDVSASDFVRELRNLEQTNQTINVRINSGGGSVFEGLAIYNAMKQSNCNIETYIDGVAASMASIVALGGKKCHMSKTARIMTHQPSTGSYGNKEEHEKNIALLAGIEKTMLAIYSNKTGKTEEECRSSFMNGGDTWFTADDAMANGLVDNIYDAEPVEMPTNAKAERTVWDAYNQKFAAVLNQTDNMKQIQLSSAILVAMSLTAEADAPAIEAKITDLVARAAKADEYKTKMEAAEQKLVDAQKQANTEKVDALIAEATTAKKLTAELATTLKADYAENPDGLKKVLDAMKPYEPVTAKLKTDGTETPEQLVAEWNKLDKNGGLTALKADNMDRYKQLFKAKFNKEYTGK